MSERKKSTGLGNFMAGRTVRPSAPARPEASHKDRRQLSDGRQQLLTYLQPEGIKQLKRLSVDREESVSALVARAVNEWFQRQQLPPLA